MRWTITMSRGEVAELLSRVRSHQVGSCDRCSAARIACGAVDFQISAGTAEEVFRRGEALAIELVRRPDVWRAIKNPHSEWYTYSNYALTRHASLRAAPGARGFGPGREFVARFAPAAFKKWAAA